MDTVDTRFIEQQSRDLFESILNGRMLGGIYDFFSHNLRVHGPLARLGFGREALMEELIELLAEFPDARFESEEMCAEVSPDSGISCFGRFRMTATKGGWGRFGAPDSREVEAAGLLCLRWEDERIVEVWWEFDDLALLRALAQDEAGFIRRAAASREEASTPYSAVFGELERGNGQAEPASPESVSTGQVDLRRSGGLASFLESLWNRRDLGLCPSLYDDQVEVLLPGGLTLSGVAELQGELLSRLAAFPDALFSADEVVHRENLAFIRWTLQGTHRGGARYGVPSGKRVRISGISCLRWAEERLAQELSLFGELQLRILLAPRQECSQEIESESFPQE